MEKEFKIKSRNSKVFFRIFPMAKMRWENIKVSQDKKVILCRCLQDFLRGNEDCEPRYWTFKTDGVFYNNSQQEIYSTVMEGVLDSVVKGNNAIVMAYGQTGTGKTLTINGLHNSFEDRGIAARIISDLFNIKASLENNKKMVILMSYIETTKIHVTDLLGDYEKLLDGNSLKHITQKKVKDEFSALTLLHKAEGLREYVRNSPYASNNSNGVLTLHVVIKKIDLTNPTKTYSKIHIVDLAGQDAVGNFSCYYKVPLDVGIGNLAKTQLEQFLLFLHENIAEKIAVKQRLSILIQYLSDSLNNYSLLRFIGHIRTTREDLMVTISMLRFSQLIKNMRSLKAEPNAEKNEDLKLEILTKQIQEFQEEKCLEAMFMNENLKTNINQDRIKHMRNVVREYLADKTNEIVMLNVTDASTVIKVFKNLYGELELEKEEATKMAYEKAYADALAKMGSTLSKDESIASGKSSKSSRRASKIQDGSGTYRRSKKPSDARARSSLKRDKSAISLKSQDKLTGLKRSKMSTGIVGKKSFQNKRRSTSSSLSKSELKRDRSSRQSAEFSLPDILPAYDDAWNLFINDPLYLYDQLSENYTVHETAAKECHALYLQEVKKLQEIMDLVELRKNELMQAQMQRQFRKKTEYDSCESLIRTEAEKVCEENIEKAEQMLVEQQEIVLKHQTELRIAINTCNDVKKMINDQFEHFCLDHYHTIIPTISQAAACAEEKIIKDVKADQEVEESKPLTAVKYNDLMKYEGLKQVMHKQMLSKINKKERNRKWVQPYKQFKL